MAEPSQSKPGTTEPTSPPAGGEAPASAPVDPGQSQPSGQTTSPSAPPSEPESFFDPESIKGKPELESAYKEMQRAFTRKMESLKGKSQAIEAYEAFQANPHEMLPKIAQQLGYRLNQINAEPQGGNGESNLENWQPNSWAEVVQTLRQHMSADLLSQVNQKLEPFLNEVKQVRKSTLETMLDQNCPDWRTYEQPMMDLLNKHPTLADDPVRLYENALPKEVRESRATQRALKKLEKAAQTQPSPGSKTTRIPSESRTGSMSFNDAVKAAKAKLAEEGITGPWKS